MGYTSQLAGLALSAGGLVLLFEMPVIGKLTTKVQTRYLIALGWLLLSIAMFYSTKRIDLQISFSAATWLRISQVLGLGFLLVPITLVAYIGIPPEKNNSVAGIVNFMRNIGSSVGTSMVTTLIARRSQFHQEILGDYVRTGSFTLQNAAGGLTFNGGVLQLATTNNLNIAEAITLNGSGGTIDTQALTGTQLSSAISGTGVLTKNGTGALTISSISNTASGGLNINGVSVVSIAADAALGTGNSSLGPVIFSAAGTLLFTSSTSSLFGMPWWCEQLSSLNVPFYSQKIFRPGAKSTGWRS